MFPLSQTKRRDLGRCPACGRVISSPEERVRLRADWFAHRRCATYEVRHLSRAGLDRHGRPLRPAYRLPASDPELPVRWSE